MATSVDNVGSDQSQAHTLGLGISTKHARIKRHNDHVLKAEEKAAARNP
jgi:hypothetical protein